MQKRAYTFGIIYLVIGCAVFSLSSIFRDSLSDFALGFCEGVSGSLIVFSAIYMIWHYIRKSKNKD